jgi:hypothetical protein
MDRQVKLAAFFDELEKIGFRISREIPKSARKFSRKLWGGGLARPIELGGGKWNPEWSAVSAAEKATTEPSFLGRLFGKKPVGPASKLTGAAGRAPVKAGPASEAVGPAKWEKAERTGTEGFGPASGRLSPEVPAQRTYGTG